MKDFRLNIDIDVGHVENRVENCKKHLLPSKDEKKDLESVLEVRKTVSFFR
jgi:hypothetical protein